MNGSKTVTVKDKQAVLEMELLAERYQATYIAVTEAALRYFYAAHRKGERLEISKGRR